MGLLLFVFPLCAGQLWVLIILMILSKIAKNTNYGRQYYSLYYVVLLKTFCRSIFP